MCVFLAKLRRYVVYAFVFHWKKQCCQWSVEVVWCSVYAANFTVSAIGSWLVIVVVIFLFYVMGSCAFVSFFIYIFCMCISS